MVKRFSVLLLLVLLSLITGGCESKQSAQNIEIPKATIKQVAAIYGENNPEIVSTKQTSEETSKKPLYLVVLKGNFHKGDLHANNLDFSIMANEQNTLKEREE